MSQKTIRSECGRIIRSAGTEESRSLPAILSTGEIARDGHKVDANGWVYPATVPLVDSHRDHEGIRTVLGNVTYIRVGSAELDSGRSVPALVGTVNYASAGVNPDAEIAYQLALAGFATGLSVSFIPLEYERATGRDRAPGAMDIHSAELLEVSAVAVPSDTSAKVLARALRRQHSGSGTTADRRAIAAAIRERVARDDADSRTTADRARIARMLREKYR
jgi:hypothetical protein